MSHRPCCALGVCCYGEHQAEAMTEALGITPEAALVIAGTSKDTGYVLIPRALPEAVPNGDPERTAAFVETAAQRLEKLHRTVKTEMKAILVDLGHEVKDEQD